MKSNFGLSGEKMDNLSPLFEDLLFEIGVDKVFLEGSLFYYESETIQA